MSSVIRYAWKSIDNNVTSSVKFGPQPVKEYHNNSLSICNYLFVEKKKWLKRKCCSINGESGWWRNDEHCRDTEDMKGSDVTCTSSPYSQLLCCTHPSICGTSLKLSLLTPRLSKTHTKALQLSSQGAHSGNKRKGDLHNILHHPLLWAFSYLVQLPNMVFKKHLGLCVQSFTQRLWVCDAQGINVTGARI